MELSEDERNDETFDDILKVVGDYGKFQRYFNWIFNFLYALVLSITFYNHIIAVSTPEHWCHVPGRPVNMTIDEWRTLTIPREINTKGEETFSKCLMYRRPFDINKNTSDVISCQHGWEYSKQWYDETFTSSENWVCDRSHYVTQSLTFGRIGDFIGTTIFGYLGDVIGRRPVFVVTVFGMVLTRMLMLITKWNYVLFMIVSFFAYFTFNSGYQSPITIILEISNAEHRARMAVIHSIGGVIGSCIAPLIMWAIPRADIFIVISSLPGLFFLIAFRYLIESPRWLLSRHKINKCHKELKRIAKVNKKEIPDDFLPRIKRLATKEKLEHPIRNVFNLFANWRLAKNTTLLCICWVVSVLCNQILIYYIEILDGNPFLNYFLQSLVHFPSNIIGQIFCDRYGRRFSLLFGNLGSTLAVLTLVFVIKNPEYKSVPVIMAVTTSFFISIARYVLGLQMLEIYPTILRQTGASFCIVCDLILQIGIPSIAALGKIYDARYPYLITFVAMSVATLLGTFLPETKDQSLPETLEEARVFGADQSYFDFFAKRKYKIANKNVII